jgi:protein phosphatase
VVSGGKHLRVAHDSLDLRALLAIVEASVAWWKQRQREMAGVAPEQAAAAIEDLSRIFTSLSEQLAQGRETMRITTRLPSQRLYTVACPRCGHGNRSSARFCQSCGAGLPETVGPLPAQAEQPPVRLTMAGCSDHGRVRPNNEDTVYTEQRPGGNMPALSLLLVADGMGGTQAGKQASSMACDIIRQELGARLQRPLPAHDEAWHDLLRQVVVLANERIYQQAQANQSYQGMGTTLTLVLVVGAQAHIAHVGDSRAYLFNAEGVTEDGATHMQLTSDHSLVARLVDIGQLSPEAARTHPQRNIIYRALGSHPHLEVDTSTQPLRPGDRLLLCSDGLSGPVDEAELLRIMLTDQKPEQLCQRLIASANERGGPDNISAVVAMVVRDGSEE